MGLVYLPTWMVDFYGFHVGKYTSPMDPMGFIALEVSVIYLSDICHVYIYIHMFYMLCSGTYIYHVFLRYVSYLS